MTTEKVKRYDMRFLDCAVRPYEDGAFVKYEDYVRLTAAHQREMAQRITPRGNDMIVPSALLDEINATGAAWKARAETAEAELAGAKARIRELTMCIAASIACNEPLARMKLRAETAEAELARLRVDAGRYAWLREHSSIVASIGGRGLGMTCGNWVKDDGDKRNLDAAIDALATQEPPSE